MELIGWISSLLMAFCAVPQCVQVYRTKKVDDISLVFLLMMFFGFIGMSMFVISKDSEGNVQYPLLLNYFCNISTVSYLIYAKWKYGSK